MPVPPREEMRTFTRIAELGNLGAAARELGLSPSAVSKQLRQLEERLGVRLLQRTTRSIALTDIGRTYLERSKAILEDIEELEASMRGLHSEPRGLLRVSAPQDFGRAYLCGVVGRFTAAYPELRVDFVLTDRTVGVVEEGFDVVLRIGAMEDSGLAVRRLGVCERVLCAAPSYLERYGRPSSPRDLERHDCIEYAYLGAQGRWRFREGDRTRSVVATGRLRVDTGWAMRSMTLAGHGIALLPSFLVREDLAAGALETVLDDVLDADLEVMLLMPHRRQIAAKVRAFSA